jgi:hypothetical protein
MPEYQGDPVTQRLDRLERENWYWKRATLLLLILIASAILIWQVRKPFRIEAREVEAESFVLKDSNGKKRVELGRDPNNNYGLRLYSADGRYLAGLVENTLTHIVELELKDNISASSAYLAVSNGIAVFTLTGNEQTREELDRKIGEIVQQLIAPKTPQETERIMSNFPSLGAVANIVAVHKDTSKIQLMNGSGDSMRNAIEIQLLKDGQTSLVLFDKNGKAVWKAP